MNLWQTGTVEKNRDFPPCSLFNIEVIPPPPPFPKRSVLQHNWDKVQIWKASFITIASSRKVQTKQTGPTRSSMVANPSLKKGNSTEVRHLVATTTHTFEPKCKLKQIVKKKKKRQTKKGQNTPLLHQGVLKQISLANSLLQTSKIILTS